MPFLRLILLLAITGALSFLFPATAVGADEAGGALANKFSTAKNKKAYGLNLTLSYPKDWTAKEGEGRHVVQNFISPAIVVPDAQSPVTVHALLLMTPMFFDIPTIDLEESKFMYNPQHSGNLIPSDGKLVDIKYGTIDSEPCAILKYVSIREKSGVRFASIGKTYAFYCKNTSIYVSFYCGGSIDNQPNIIKVFTENEKLFQEIVDSIKIADKSYDPGSPAARNAPKGKKTEADQAFAMSIINMIAGEENGVSKAVAELAKQAKPALATLRGTVQTMVKEDAEARAANQEERVMLRSGRQRRAASWIRNYVDSSLAQLKCGRIVTGGMVEGSFKEGYAGSTLFDLKPAAGDALPVTVGETTYVDVKEGKSDDWRDHKTDVRVCLAVDEGVNYARKMTLLATKAPAGKPAPKR
ncbi:MAG: hypothetical protein LBR22_02060 [Desulfovibrio sp.]|jgi:hypothetical protein|nr:hypothetical protein [Desulfovibrio sp.]